MNVQTQFVETHVERARNETVHHFTIDERSGWPIHTLVAEAVEEVADRPTNEIEPLSDSIDPDALDHLFQPRPNGEPRGDGEVTFPLDEFCVTVTSEGCVVIAERN